MAVATTEKKIICCCCGFKMWTRIIGWIGLIGCLLAGFVGTTVFAFMIDDAGAIHGPEDNRWGIVVIIWAFIGLAIFLNVSLLVGNEKEKVGFFVPWLTCSWISIVLSVIGVFGLIFLGGDFQSVFAALGQLAVSGFFLFAVQHRRDEIHKNSGCFPQQRSSVTDAKV